MHNAGPMAKFPKMPWLKWPVVNTRYVIKVDWNDSWAEIEISIVAHKLLIEKYDFDKNRC